ncbi:MAG: hypothetical protein COV47_00405 [Candidatus Diapherotrites archaeon CG11_big_fil_rev_8_21_14_0_20_37_9]|nr:MAG: hypothetical protein COV47_00405 [Candidatus Diapherotrites archaeon CG11_big_fil_rev_8_21_14_0_20_37_9]
MPKPKKETPWTARPKDKGTGSGKHEPRKTHTIINREDVIEAREKFREHCRKHAKHIEVIAQGSWNAPQSKMKVIGFLMQTKIIGNEETIRFEKAKSIESEEFQEYVNAIKRFAGIE